VRKGNKNGVIVGLNPILGYKINFCIYDKKSYSRNCLSNI